MSEVPLAGLMWLSAAADDPAASRAMWRRFPRHPQVLPTGIVFDAVTVGLREGIEAVDLARSGNPSPYPALVDLRAQRAGFLLPTGHREVFTTLVEEQVGGELIEYRYIGEGGCIVVPGPAALPGDRFQWATEPCGPVSGFELRFMAVVEALAVTSALAGSGGYVGVFADPLPLAVPVLERFSEEMVLSAEGDGLR